MPLSLNIFSIWVWSYCIVFLLNRTCPGVDCTHPGLSWNHLKHIWTVESHKLFKGVRSGHTGYMTCTHYKRVIVTVDDDQWYPNPNFECHWEHDTIPVPSRSHRVEKDTKAYQLFNMVLDKPYLRLLTALPVRQLQRYNIGTGIKRINYFYNHRHVCGV